MTSAAGAGRGPFGIGFAVAFVFTPDRLADQINPFGQPAFVIAVPEMRINVARPDVECHQVRERAFQTVTHLDGNLPVLDKHQHHDPVTLAVPFLPDAPGLGNSLAVIFHRGIAFHFSEDGDYDLVRGFPLELGELLIETEPCFLGNYAGVIIEIAGWFRRDNFRGGQEIRAQQEDGGERENDPCHR